jgi:hypothetical protein
VVNVADHANDGVGFHFLISLIKRRHELFELEDIMNSFEC